MKQWLVFCITVALLGCEVPSAPELTPIPEGDPLAKEPDIIMMGAQWHIHTVDAESEDGQYLLITLSADTFSRPAMEDEVYQIQKVTAIVHVPGEAEDRITLKAGRGEYIEGKRVFMEEEVQAYWGDFVISLQDVLWQPGLEGAPGIISTDKPVHFEGALWNAAGSGMELHPESKTIVVKDIRGEFSFEETTP